MSSKPSRVEVRMLHGVVGKVNFSMDNFSRNFEFGGVTSTGDFRNLSSLFQNKHNKMHKH